MTNNIGKTVAGGVATTALTSQFVNLLQQPKMPGANADLQSAYGQMSNFGEVRGGQIGENEAVMQNQQLQQNAFKQSMAEALASTLSPAQIDTLIAANNRELQRMQVEAMKPLTASQLEMASADAKLAENQRSAANELSTAIASFNQQARAFESKIREQQQAAFLSTVQAIPMMIRAGTMIDKGLNKTEGATGVPAMAEAFNTPFNSLKQWMSDKPIQAPKTTETDMGEAPALKGFGKSTGPTKAEINDRLNTIEDFDDLEVVARPMNEILAEPDEIAESDAKLKTKQKGGK